MRTSAEPPRSSARAAAANCAGFTLLEVMVTLAVVVTAIVPMLFARDKAWNIALRTSNMMKAATYAEEILADHLLDPDDRKEWPGVYENDPMFRYEITLETYDLSTGRVESDGTQDGYASESGFSSSSAFAPPDALDAPTKTSTEDPDDPHRVRRYRVVITFPGYEDEESEEEFVLEGYAPVALDLPLPGMPP
ncbi:MAG: type II secretion system protein [Planctomycetota bacterium]|jgi:prepilin-type N-terminal cleavage/methylation domain-containing protein